ncbi:MAG: hypothetical protein QY307_04085 [Acidimicrobiia bacterium]|nr:MAG: hypothetical protein QY307_04085 [Acidimicrobiia bacterium]
MRLRKGMRFRELTRKVGQVGREGRVLGVQGSTVHVLWDDGHRSSVSGGHLIPVVRRPST